MQVSAISDSIYRNSLNKDFSAVSIKGSDSADENNNETSTPENDKNTTTPDNKIFYVNQWKQYCHRQIKEGMLDINA